MDTGKLRTSAVAVGAVSLLALGYGIGNSSIGHTEPAKPAAAVGAAAGSGARSGVALPDFSSIVAQYGPAVVNVRVSGMVATGEHEEHDMPGPYPDAQDPFGDLFRRFQQQVPHQAVPMRGMGSGFIVSKSEDH